MTQQPQPAPDQIQLSDLGCLNSASYCMNDGMVVSVRHALDISTVTVEDYGIYIVRWFTPFKAELVSIRQVGSTLFMPPIPSDAEQVRQWVERIILDAMP